VSDQTHQPTHEAPPPATVVGSTDAHEQAAAASAESHAAESHSPEPQPMASSPAPEASSVEQAAPPGAVREPHAHSTESPADESVAEAPVAEEPEAAEPVAAEVEEEIEDVTPLEEIKPSDDPPDLRWYILKVQSNREDSIREALQRRVAMSGLDRFFGDVIVPTEMVSEFKGGKKRIVKRKLYPGYLVVRMEINEDTWFAVRETPGIGDFTGSAGKPTPMLPNEVSRILAKQEEKSEEVQKVTFEFAKGDRVRIKEGTFENFEGEVDGIDEGSGRVTVMINIFGRSTPVELEHWQIETL